MRRRTHDEKVERLRLDRLDELEPLRRQAWRWAMDHAEQLRTLDPEVPEELHDRAQDNWRHLLAIAFLAGGEWPEKARLAALALSGVPADNDESAGILALHDVGTVFTKPENSSKDALTSEEIVEYLLTLDERPWPEWSHGRPLSKSGLARLLAPFGIKPRAIKIGGRTLRGYRRDALSEPLSRYPVLAPESIPPSELQPPQPCSNHAENPASEKCNSPQEVTDSKSALNPHPRARVARVADEDPGLGPGGLWDEGGRDTIGDEEAT